MIRQRRVIPVGSAVEQKGGCAGGRPSCVPKPLLERTLVIQEYFNGGVGGVFGSGVEAAARMDILPPD